MTQETTTNPADAPVSKLLQLAAETRYWQKEYFRLPKKVGRNPQKEEALEKSKALEKELDALIELQMTKPELREPEQLDAFDHQGPEDLREKIHEGHGHEIQGKEMEAKTFDLQEYEAMLSKVGLKYGVSEAAMVSLHESLHKALIS